MSGGGLCKAASECCFCCLNCAFRSCQCMCFSTCGILAIVITIFCTLLTVLLSCALCSKGFACPSFYPDTCLSAGVLRFW
nr:hypothetical protein [Blunervirus sp.]